MFVEGFRGLVSVAANDGLNIKMFGPLRELG